MKRFGFPLDRVLDFRRLEMERIEARLSEVALRAHNEQRTAKERRMQALESGQQLLQRANLKGADFHITRHWLDRLETECDQALAASENLARQHRQVRNELIEARRKVKLLELLRKRRLNAHRLSIDKQVEAQATEFFLAKRIREQKR